MKKFYLLLFLILLPFSTMAKEKSQSVIQETLEIIDARYITPVDHTDLIFNGIQALHDFDPQITITKGTDRFYMYKDRQIFKIFSFPEDRSNLNNWSNLIEQIIDSSIKISDKIALKDFEIPDRIIKKMVTHLDPYSHFYSKFDYDDNEQENSIYTLYSDRLINKNILYMRIRIFNKQTAKQVKQSILNHPNITGIIMDLRGNSGGVFNEALKVADMLTDDEIITYTAGRNNENIHYYTSKSGTIYDGPLVIISDADTASAAEVVSGGLQEQSRAKIVGTQTFGKGTIQNVISLSNGGKLVLTTEQFFTPSGKKIHKKGIQPDICVTEINNDLCEPQSRLRVDDDIQRAVDLLRDSN